MIRGKKKNIRTQVSGEKRGDHIESRKKTCLNALQQKQKTNKISADHEQNMNNALY